MPSECNTLCVRLPYSILHLWPYLQQPSLLNSAQDLQCILFQNDVVMLVKICPDCR